LEGTAASPQDIEKAAAVVAEGFESTSDLHASAAYRGHMVKVYAARALAIAFSRAS
jgi:CO/xanthine dehydrogenase FAD-binding subunit